MANLINMLKKISSNSALAKRLELKEKIKRYFDADWYSYVNPDVGSSKIKPYEHFIRFGWREGRSPSIMFDVAYYLKNNEDVKKAKINPLEHYLERGWREGRNPNRLFDVKWYLDQYMDVREAGIEPLHHFVKYGALEGRNPHPLFDTSWYLSTNPDVQHAGMNPLAHFLSSGGMELRKPHPLFDAPWYFEQYGSEVTITHNPIVDYLESGWKSGRNPNPLFDSQWYVNQHELLRLTGENPLVNYVTRGQFEGRDPHPDFDSEWYLLNNADVRVAKRNPLEHYLGAGQFEGRRYSESGLQSDLCNVLDIPYEIKKAPSSYKGKDFCLFVTYSAYGNISAHALRYFRALKSAGLSVITIIVTEGFAGAIPEELLNGDGLIVRRNHGWDFAAWATALAAIPGVWQANSIIFTNDSVFGPVNPEKFVSLINRFKSSDADVFGLTDSHQVSRHIMSYFIGLKNKALRSSGIQEYWNNIKSYADKNKVIYNYEIGNGSVYFGKDLTVDIAFPTPKGATDINPTLHSWRQLIKAGFPFVKVQALRDDIPGVDRSKWQTALVDNAALISDIEKHLNGPQSNINIAKLVRPIPPQHSRYIVPSRPTNDIGAIAAVRPVESSDYAIELPFGFNVDKENIPSKVAVVVHIFYVDLTEEIRTALQRIPTTADVFVSTDCEIKKSEILKVFSKYTNGNVEIRVFPNLGRDIAPFLVGFRDVFDEYDYFLHLHSKKSPYGSAHEGWREYLIDTLIGTEESIAGILNVLHRSDAGVVFADHFSGVKNLINWGFNFPNVKDILNKCGITIDASYVLEFPSSSFFWGRSAAIRPLLDLRLSWDDFPPEGGQQDGTVAHAIERSLLYICEAVGYRWVKVGVRQFVDNARLLPVHAQKDLELAVLRAHQPLLGNEIRPVSFYSKTEEVVPAYGVKESSQRLRFNLVIPTIRPQETYGGISTAIKVFKAISAHMPSDVDFRIIVTQSEIDMEASRYFPDYVVISGDTVPVEMHRSIVNVQGKRVRKKLGIRSSDVFMTTAWWTDKYAEKILALQETFFSRSLPHLYFIQDYEVGFYPWSTRFALAESTYKLKTDSIALINSEELAGFMRSRGLQNEGYVVRYSMNETLKSSMVSVPKERVLVFYGRPSAPRNCFELICMALSAWQSRNPQDAARWKIVSAGEAFDPDAAKPASNVEVLGKLSLSEYANLLSRASVGISLMVSPHPSYPPMEMASAGLITVTNDFENKMMESRHDNFISLENLNVENLTDAIDEAVKRAETNIGKNAKLSEIKSLPCDLPDFDPSVVAQRLIQLARP